MGGVVLGVSGEELEVMKQEAHHESVEFSLVPLEEVLFIIFVVNNL